MLFSVQCSIPSWCLDANSLASNAESWCSMFTPPRSGLTIQSSIEYCSMFTVQCSMLNVQCSDVEDWMLSVEYWVLNVVLCSPPSVQCSTLKHQCWRLVEGWSTVNRGYFAQRGYSAQSVFPLLGLHKLIVSQTWALKLFQYWVHALSCTLLKVFSHFKQCYYNNLPFCIKLIWQVLGDIFQFVALQNWP